jgi:hypothetical protein
MLDRASPGQNLEATSELLDPIGIGFDQADLSTTIDPSANAAAARTMPPSSAITDERAVRIDQPSVLFRSPLRHCTRMIENG